MSKRGLKQRFLRLSVGLLLGGSLFQIGGCDPQVRSALLMGLESTTTSLSDTLISAFFISLQSNSTSNQNLTTTSSP
ncbi:MAG TPA: hypothetical protein VGM03_24845 [Phycisphaerae bacterium]|jgi:hypothetical protein